MFSHFSSSGLSSIHRRGASLVAALIVGSSLCCVQISPVEAQSTPTRDPASPASIPDLPQSMRDATATLDDLDTVAESSGDLRTRALLTWRNPLPGFPEGSAALAALTKLGPSDDPVILMLLATGCDAEALGCDALPLASRWTAIDADNGAAWLELWNIDTRLGDTAGAEAALARAIAARDWRDYTVELSQAFIRVGDGSEDLLVRLVVRLQAAPRVVGIVNALYRAALGLCRLPSKRDQCIALTNLISDRPASLLQATVAASLSAHFGASPTQVQARRNRIEAWQWAVAQGQPGGLRSDDPRANAQEVITYIDRLNEHGEAVAARDILLARHLSDQEAAALYRAERDSGKRIGGDLQDQSGAGLHLPSH